MFWTREIAGWLMILLGIWLFYVSYFVLLLNNKIVQSGPTVLMGIILFRGGIHLLKVAVAARVCRQPAPEPPRPARAGTYGTRPVPSVVPGRR